MMKLYAKIPQEEVIYKGKIRKTGNGQGYVYMNDQYLGYRAYIIFPQKYEFDGENYWITIDQVVNKGVHPDNDHTFFMMIYVMFYYFYAISFTILY